MRDLGIPYLLIRVAVRLSPETLVFARCFPAAVLLLPVAVHRGYVGPVLARWRWVLVYSVVELCVPWYLLSSAEQHLTSSVAALLIATVPLIGVVLARMTGGERVGGRRLAGLLLGLGGVAVLVGVDVHGNWPAVAATLVVALGYATGPFIIAHRLADLPSLGVVAGSLAVTAVLYAPAGLTHRPSHVERARSRRGGRADPGVHGAGLPALLRPDRRDGARPGPPSSPTSTRRWPSCSGWCSWTNR